MRLIDLDPRWIHPSVLIFRCPCCIRTDRTVWLSCKEAVLSTEEQTELFRSLRFYQTTSIAQIIVGAAEQTVWTFDTHDVTTMTVTPSLDCSKARHWHGRIVKGTIV